MTENSRLAQKVEQASILVTNGMVVTPAKKFSGTTIKETDRADQTVGLKIECNILDNNVVDPGTVTIYARVATANNRLVSNGDAIAFVMDGVTMQCTAKQDIEFTGMGRKISMVWRKLDSVEMAAGLYWVTLYANGHEIGKKSFILK